MDNIIEVLLITGGGYPEYTVETWSPADGASCSLPNMTRPRSDHTISGGLVCGDYGPANRSCEVWRAETGQWEEVVTNLTDERNGHVSWTDSEGTTFLLGGMAPGTYTSVETISKEYTVTPASFSLKQKRA